MQSTDTNSKFKTSAVEGDLNMENYSSNRSAPLQEIRQRGNKLNYLAGKSTLLFLNGKIMECLNAH